MRVERDAGFIDICYPDGNEEAFIRTAKRLGTAGLVMVYNDPKKALSRKPMASPPGFRVYTGLDTNQSSRNRLGMYDLILSSSNSRKDIENGTIQVHYNLENFPEKDRTHYRSSGLNQVLGRIIKDKDKAIAISFGNLSRASDVPRAVGRISQNIRLARKLGVMMCMSSFASSPHRLRSSSVLKGLSICLGMTAEESAASLKAIGKMIGKS